MKSIVSGLAACLLLAGSLAYAGVTANCKSHCSDKHVKASAPCCGKGHHGCGGDTKSK